MAQDNFEELHKALSAEYREGVPGRLAELDRLWGEFLKSSATDTLAAELLTEIRRHLHSIAGSARTFGLPGLTEAAREAEVFIEPWCETGDPPAPERRAAFERLLDALKRSALQT